MTLIHSLVGDRVAFWLVHWTLDSIPFKSYTVSITHIESLQDV